MEFNPMTEIIRGLISVVVLAFCLIAAFNV